LDGHSAADDVGRKALEFLDALADLGLHRRRSIEVVKANLYRELHDGLTALVRSGGQCSGSAAWRTLVDIRMLLPGERRRRRGRAAEAKERNGSVNVRRDTRSHHRRSPS